MRVVIIEEQRMLGEALNSALHSEGIEVAGMTDDPAVAIDLTDAERPDMVLVGSGLDSQAQLNLARKIIDGSPDTKVVAISEDSIEPRTHTSEDQGLAVTLANLARAERGRLMRGAEVRKARTRGGDDGFALLASQLTPRELEVLRLLVEGMNSKEMAKRLTLRPNTVKTHVHNVLTKLQVHSRVEAAACAVRHGLVRGELSSSPERPETASAGR